MDFINVFNEKYGIQLNKQQWQAATHLYGPALVLAGPGSGKTTVITARTAYLIFIKGISPENILTMTFNISARYEMEQRFNSTFASAINKKSHFSTFHSFCNRIVMDYEKRQGKRLKRIEGDDVTRENKRKIIKNIYQQINGSIINEDEMEDLINQIGLMKNKMIKSFDDMDFNIKNFPLIYLAYEEYKKSNFLMDYDDMLTYAYSMLVKCPDILSYYKNKYHFIQVDEGQDLSKIQFEILNLLVKPGESNLFVVADDDQSIYGFRGAEPYYILNMEKQFPGCKLFKLENNYRSSKNIVEISSNFIKNNAQRYDKNHRTDNEYHSDPLIIHTKDEYEQLKIILEKVKAHLNEKEDQKVAILYRNNISSIAIADFLDRNGIDFMLKQNKVFFFSHWLVQDMLAFLYFALDQRNSESFMRIYYKMNRYISKAMVEYALSIDYGESIIDGILLSGEMKPYQRKNIADIKKEFKRLAKKHPTLALDYIENVFGYFDSVKDYCKNTGTSFDYLYYLYGILRIIAAECNTISLFLSRIKELKNLFDRPQHTGYNKYITLTTMHSSKGLEYDCVFMVDLTESDIPGKQAMDLSQINNDHIMIEEERRLFYVGMTRAKKYLYLISPKIRNGLHEPESIFINEVISCQGKAMLNKVGEGMMISHKYFGEGTIASVLKKNQGEITIVVDFRGIRRKLDFVTCIEKGIIGF